MVTGARGRRLVCGALLAAAICAPAEAQETGTLIQRKAAQIQDRGKNAARLTMESFAECLVSRSRGRVTKFAGMRVDDPGYGKYLRSLFDAAGDACLSGGQLQFNSMVFRGAVFQALYAAEFPTSSAPVDFSALPSSGYRDRYGGDVPPAARNAIALEQFGECVARADGAGVRALLGANANSSDETARFNALVPRFSACIPKGETLAFSKIVLKGAVAEGMYWLSKAAEDGAAAAP